jgi:DNA-binding NarL/FixJ family response regulator
MKSLSVLVADHHPLFAEGIRTVLTAPGNNTPCHVTAVARNSEQVEGYLNEAVADILLINPNLPQASENDLIGRMKARYAQLRILLISSANDPQVVQRALKGGADGYLLRTTSKDELKSAIREVGEGHIYIGRGVQSMPSESKANAMVNTSPSESAFVRKYALTKREMEIVRYIGQALTNKEIGDRLYISDQTVSVHRKNIMRKLKVNSTASLIRMVFENQIPLGTA